MTGIPSNLNDRLRDVLPRCGPFDGNRVLTAVFADSRIAAWRDAVPDASATRAGRVDALIGALWPQYNPTGENALVLLLQVLGDRADPRDVCHDDLHHLADEVAAAVPIKPQADLQALLDADKVPPPGDLPPGSRMPFGPNARFTGREPQLLALARALFPPRPPGEGLGVRAKVLITQAIQGMGGVGKTQLAVALAYRCGRYLHGVHWVNAAQPEAIGAEVAACGRAMGLRPWPDALPDQVALTLRVWQDRSFDVAAPTLPRRT